MRIFNNLPALTAFNSLNKTNNELNKVLSSLSTGLRINSASDDAAGLAISQKMRSQISGLNAAMRNSQDGISFLQTAEGALEQTNSMLQRMRELAVQASNDSLTSNDRQYIQLEIDELKEQIDKIANTTQFNKKKILDGSSGALWSSSNINVKARINGGLTYINEHGQEVSSEGNYKIEIKAVGGKAQVQKSNIFSFKREEITETTTEIVTEITNIPGVNPEPTNVDYEININTGLDTLEASSGDGWNFSSSVLNITSDGTYYIVGTGAVTGNSIRINSGVNATVFLKNVNIRSNQYAFNMAGANVDLYLEGTNNFQSGSIHAAGLQTSSSANLTISSASGDYSTSGTLTTTGSVHGAGIGGSCSSVGGGDRNAGTITIKGGTINAIGGQYGAGIGGGNYGGTTSGGGTYSTITIEGGIINATGGFGGAGIGTGANAQNYLGTNNGTIILKGGQVNATGGSAYSLQQWGQGAGIGGGSSFGGGTIKINSDTSLLTLTKSGYTDSTQTESIGYGQYASGGTVSYENMTLPSARDIPDHPQVNIAPPAIPGETIVEEIEKTSTQTTIKNSTLAEISNFCNSEGKCILEKPQTLTITQGNGNKTNITLYENDTIYDVATKINNAIANSLNQGKYTDNSDKFCTISDGTDNTSESVYKRMPMYDDDGNFTGYEIHATMLIRSVIPGKAGELYFSGDQELLNALGLNTIQSSSESIYAVSVSEAHSGKVIASDMKITGNILHGAISPNVDVEFDSMAERRAVWNEKTKSYVLSDNSIYTSILHLKDNKIMLQIGANNGEKLSVQIGSSSSEALEISEVNVLTRETASRSISIIDNALDKVLSQRAKIGTYENALQRTMEILAATNMNLTTAESRIRDADMAKTMMNFVKLQILNQTETSMLAQSNQLPNSVLKLMQ